MPNSQQLLGGRMFARWLAPSLWFVACIGCSGSSHIAHVAGTVTLDGKPVPNALVVFSPIPSGRPSEGKTDDAGRYQLVYSSTEKGARIGQHEVHVTTALTEITADGGGLRNLKESIPAKYNTKGHLEREVRAGKNVIDLQLEK